MYRKIIMFLFCCGQLVAMAQQPGKGVFNQPVQPGPAGVFILVYDTLQRSRLPESTYFVVSREDKKGGGFKKLATLNFPASVAELEKRIDKNLLQEIIQQRKLSSASDLWAQLKAGRYDTLGLYSISPPVLAALGRLYIDKEITKANESVSYQVEAFNNGASRVLYRQSLQAVTYSSFPSFKQYQRVASDSAAMATWYAVDGLANFAQVFASSSSNRSFSNRSRLFVYNRQDTLFATYGTGTRPGDRLSFFIRPTDLAGNLGPASDTINLLALSLTDLVSITDLQAKDSLGGILLQWKKLPVKAYYSGIQVLKSRSATAHFIVADTIAATATTYLDRKVLPGTQYYYIVEPILFDLPQHGKVTAATVTASAKATVREIPAPQGITTSFTNARDIKISWQPNSELNLFAYYVLRGTSRENMRVISAALRDTLFIDSLKDLHAGATYLYAVRAMDMDMHWSDTSDLVSVLPPKARLVTPPAGLAARSTGQGVRLYWNDVARTDASVIGYMIYKRKKGEKYFTPLSTTLIPGSYFTDTAIGSPGTYEYGCAAADAWSNQSILSSLAEVTITGASYLYPPADFNVRNLVAGIEISVPPSVDTGNEQNSYIIYRRLVSGKSPFQKIGETPVSKSIYIDKQVNKEQLYAYTVSVKQQQAESKKSGEKTIRRK